MERYFIGGDPENCENCVFLDPYPNCPPRCLRDRDRDEILWIDQQESCPTGPTVALEPERARLGFNKIADCLKCDFRVALGPDIDRCTNVDSGTWVVDFCRGPFAFLKNRKLEPLK